MTWNACKYFLWYNQHVTIWVFRGVIWIIADIIVWWTVLIFLLLISTLLTPDKRPCICQSCVKGSISWCTDQIAPTFGLCELRRRNAFLCWTTVTVNTRQHRLNVQFIAILMHEGNIAGYRANNLAWDLQEQSLLAEFHLFSLYISVYNILI